MSEEKQYINQTIKKINEMTELLYQEQIQDALAIMNEILDRILHISEFIMPVNQIEEADKTKVIGILGDAMNAMEQKDYVLLADVLHYDMIEILETYINKL